MPVERPITPSDGLVPSQAPDQEPAEVDMEAFVKQLETNIEAHSTRETLSSGAIVRFEQFSTPLLTGISAHFGQEFRRPELDGKIKQLLEDNPEKSAAERWAGPIGYSAGFGTLWRTPESHSREQIHNDTLEVAVGLAKRLIEQKGWDPREIDIVDFANSAMEPGMSDALRQRLIEELHMREDIDVPGTAFACDGAGNTLLRRMINTDSQGKKVLLLSVDQVTSEMPLNPEQVDTLSMQIFSNGAAGLAYQPGVDMKLIAGTTEEHEDTEGVLTATPPYSALIDEIDAINPGHQGIIYHIGNDHYMKLPKPKEGGKGRMNGARTAKFFWDIAQQNIIETYEKYKKYCSEQGYADREVDFAVGHHPSHAVYRGLIHRFEKLKKIKGIDIKLPVQWVVPDGNSSGATSLIALVRSVSQFKPGDHVFYISYGAGGGATSFIFEVGGDKASSEEPRSIAA